MDLALVIASLVSIGWGYWLWRNAETLSPDSWVYRYLLADWRTGPRSQKSKIKGLTPRRIRYYAVLAIVSGFILLISGVVAILQ